MQSSEHVSSTQAAVEAAGGSPACTKLNIRRDALIPFPLTFLLEAF